MELTKDHSILQILTHLEQRFGKNTFTITDYWDADLCAIGLADHYGKYLLYISTYEKPKGTFYVEVEDTTKTNTAVKSTNTFERITEGELDSVFEQYFINQNA